MKAAIYLRTSTPEQHPEKQEKECVAFAKARGYEIEGIYSEQLSGFKDIVRPQYELVKEKARTGKINCVICWALDRWVRKRDTLLLDITILRNYGVKIHSVKESWLEAINIDGSLGQTIQDFLLGLIGSLGEMESQRKSDRVKMAHKSHKGKKWGRPVIRKKTNDEIIELHKQGVPLRKISQTVFYWNRNNNKKFISVGYVHKIVTDFKNKNISLNDNSTKG